MIGKTVRKCSLITSLHVGIISPHSPGKSGTDAEEVVFSAVKVAEPHVRIVPAVEDIVRIGFQIVPLI
jgi:hypothetical protein